MTPFWSRISTSTKIGEMERARCVVAWRMHGVPSSGLVIAFLTSCFQSFKGSQIGKKDGAADVVLHHDHHMKLGSVAFAPRLASVLLEAIWVSDILKAGLLAIQKCSKTCSSIPFGVLFLSIIPPLFSIGKLTRSFRFFVETFFFMCITNSPLIRILVYTTETCSLLVVDSLERPQLGHRRQDAVTGDSNRQLAYRSSPSHTRFCCPIGRTCLSRLHPEP